MMPSTPDCPLCGTWKCDVCGHKSYYQNPRFLGTRKCPDCGSQKGTFRGVRHSSAPVRREHEAIHDFLPTTEHKFEHYRSWDQYASFLARQEMEEMMEQAMPKSPARYHTPQDFEQAEWAKHSDGLFAHRRGFDSPDGFPWVLINKFDVAENYSDEGMAERGDFEIVETGTVITRRKLEQIADSHESDLVPDVEGILVKAGVKIVEDKPLPIPQDFGVRFVARKDDGPVEWEFITARHGDDLRILCTDQSGMGGMFITPAEFITRGFHVMELL